MPATRFFLTLCLLGFCGPLAACTSTDLVGGADLAPTDLASTETAALSLPEQIGVMPSPAEDRPAAQDTTTAIAEAVQAASAAPTDASPVSDGSLAAKAAALPVGYAGPAPQGAASAALAAARPVAARSAELDMLIAKYASHYGLPVDLVRRVVKRESNFDPSARNRIYWGLMQIRHDTARTMGYRGPPEGLLDAETNLRYAVKYLRGAYITAGGDHDRAVRFYASGYYYDAKRKGLLEETGLRS